MRNFILLVSSVFLVTTQAKPNLLTKLFANNIAPHALIDDKPVSCSEMFNSMKAVGDSFKCVDNSNRIWSCYMNDESELKCNKLTTEFKTTKTICADHHLAVKYDQGSVYLAGTTPDQKVHTNRDDCGSYPQGWQVAIQQAPNARIAVIKFEAYAEGVACTGEYEVDSNSQKDWVASQCTWAIWGSAFPEVILTLSFRY